MNLTLHRFNLPLRWPFTISRGTITVQPTLIAELADGSLRGYGEATESEYYGATIESMTRSLEAARARIESHDLVDPERLWDELSADLSGDPFARCALDQAAHDLWGKKLGQPVYKLWGLSAENLPLTSFTIGIDTIEVMVQKLQQMPGWPIYKVKLGTPHDVQIVRALREHTDAIFRVDVNGAWTARETIENSLQLRELNVEFIEQPLAASQWEDMKSVFAHSALPVISDESCVTLADVERCAGLFHGVNIKLVKCGGLTPARRMIRRAKMLGLRTMVGCMTESTVGVSAIAQLLPLLDYVDMDGPLLLSRDIASGVRINRGRVEFANENGCGVRLLES